MVLPYPVSCQHRIFLYIVLDLRSCCGGVREAVAARARCVSRYRRASIEIVVGVMVVVVRRYCESSVVGTVPEVRLRPLW